ncbi:MAG: sugar transferase [Actinomycetota bacterium]|nr:sugar transferase [Actinomycetota bacterium]
MANRFLRSIFFSDMVALVAGILAGSWVAFGTPAIWAASLPAGGSIWPLVAMLALGATIASYVSLVSWAQVAPRPSYGRAFGIVGITIAITAVGLVVTRAYWSRSFLGVTLVVWLILMIVYRYVLRRRPWTERMVLVTGEESLAQDLRDVPHTDVATCYKPRDEPPGDPLPAQTTLVVDLRAVLSEEMAQWVSSASIAGTNIRAMAPTYEQHTGRIPMVHLAEGWELSQPVYANGYGPLKRTIDIVLTFVTLPFWLILAVVIGIAVRIDSPGPVIYHQERVGKDGDRFTLYKFRTMVKDAEINGPKFAAEDDPRLTRTGRLLRKTRMDELPQLWNVLKGNLSLVGPRPERPVFVSEYMRTIPFYNNRSLIRPGVTGWAQVNYGYADDEADAIEKLTYDLYYVKHMALGLDFQILGKSIWTVLTGFGAR